MAVPQSCTVLVIGGGPAGSYAAAALAREGIETVLLEADKFPRTVQFSDSLKLSPMPASLSLLPLPHYSHPSCGSDAYAWNLIRSESDDLLFRHAGTCGAHIFDETKVDAIQFEPDLNETSLESNRNSNGVLNPGRPVSVTWVRKDGTSGSITSKYLVDASGRHGILSTKYLKNRKFNDNFKNVANWAYWKSDKLYGPGTHMEGSPYFEALDDASGWAWFMPLHDGTRSVGIVQDQKIATKKKRELGRPSTLDFYKQCLEMAPRTKELLSEAEVVTEVKSASDWSYTASAYHLPNARICGDAGSFIDPLFSSGVHLAVTGGLSAAATIAASIRGDCDEQTAGSWHSKKTVESYTRFFLAVSSATKQIREQYEPIIQDMDEEGFQRAFDILRPIIQGTVDADSTGKMSQSEISKALEFCFRAFTYVPPEQKDALFEKLKKLGVKSGQNDATAAKALDDIQKHLTVDELQVLETLRSRRMIREDPFEMDSFTLDTIDGLAPNLVRGKLGLVKSKQVKIDRAHFYSPRFLDGKCPGIREGSVYLPTSNVQLG
ncbi:FAD/NAD(P)-binding domain-containing protein [Penicillium longicatenatum]|uniref:FAD/NAD(P)-binding domain-containing protein n=1 Tax=Penicillium longicatenatum TaxID=1561947 RepID=UPI002548AF98|nr:FAD/NAD(P)-binding domain-containing protein [Penicillium longicatenatum]KAJ5649329.1 FAD/NAD(P)-binding domain-containing protein [Penicillium longicatenatum]